ncbi:protein PEAK3-like [Pogoniulus pusillus]|uniref:protein PEAK3-like n=1 Tax=Pogoniulus pusillus TaxID=488313 RepID=UPI0030B92A37
MQAQGLRGRCASLDLGTPGPPAPMPDTSGGCLPPPSSALIYSNVGQLRAHLVPHKASRGEGAARPSPPPAQDPPPLPKKQLQRAESLPEPGAAQHCRGGSLPRASSILYSAPAPHLQQQQQEGGAGSSLPRPSPIWGPKKLLTKSRSLEEALGWSCSSPSPAGFGLADGELGQLLESAAGVWEVVLGCQEATLGRLSARISEELLGQEEQQQLLEAELAGKSWAALSILQPEPCCQSRDAWYFPVGFTLGQTQLVLAAKGKL